ncbi:MAG: nucleoside 2-deoxyribosyltransferase [Methanobacterium sp.]|nr:nucleoside 2-deoxyribosyltransferase [Methanobacterium sp.]
MSNEKIIYPAAALFNARETYFNSTLMERLENLEYKINFPQKDGYEFVNLKEALEDKIPPDEIDSAVSNIIYFLDMGVFIPSCDVVLANLDEPVDEGVVIEAAYAKLMGKFVIGVRTDVRSPYGSSNNIFGGMHFFSAYQSHIFITHYMPCCTPAEREIQMDKLISKIDKTIKDAKITHQNELPDYAQFNPNIKQILDGAEILFKDIHPMEDMERIISRYMENHKKLEDICSVQYFTDY